MQRRHLRWHVSPPHQSCHSPGGNSASSTSTQENCRLRGRERAREASAARRSLAVARQCGMLHCLSPSTWRGRTELTLLVQDDLHCINAQGIKVRFIQIWDLEKVKEAMGPQTKMVHVESPSNPLMMVSTVKCPINLQLFARCLAHGTDEPIVHRCAIFARSPPSSSPTGPY